jgi:hypothetical protein
MPEMAMCCGQEFTVLKQVEKVNDLVDRTGLRRMKGAVILDGNRCNGSSHGGCQALCQSIWKEAWLIRAGSERGRSLERTPDGAANRAQSGLRRGPSCTEADLFRSCVGVANGTEQRFRCQQTEIKKASSYLAWWDPRQYWRDWWSGNVRAGEMVRATMFWFFRLAIRHNPGYRLLVPAYDRLQRLRGAEPYPYRVGTLDKTPVARLDLQPGEWVQVKSYDEILATLNANNKNRGLWFDAEMVKYCNGVYKVLCRVERIIDPKSGTMLKLENDCLTLDGVTTRGDHHRFYPQNEYPFWREIWLRRAASTAHASETR